MQYQTSSLTRPPLQAVLKMLTILRSLSNLSVQKVYASARYRLVRVAVRSTCHLCPGRRDAGRSRAPEDRFDASRRGARGEQGWNHSGVERRVYDFCSRLSAGRT